MDDINKALAAPFDPKEVKFRAGAIAGARALALAYVDARVIQDRLDAVVGPTGWQDDYDPLPDGSVVCRLRLKIGDEWLCKVDVGGPSEQPDGGDRLKAAFSDALKRAAVKFGVGRYLYRLTSQWVDYDPQKRQIIKAPQLPDWALPGKQTKPGGATPAPAAKPASPPPDGRASADARPSSPPPNRPRTPPGNGTELLARLDAYEADLVKHKLCAAGELLGHLLANVKGEAWPEDPKDWDSEQIKAAVAGAVAFKEEALARQAANDRDGIR
jgi:hypothetical protein